MRKTMIMPRLMILAASAAVAAIALVVVASTNLALAASSLVNGNFEAGDLSGWTVDTTGSGGTASASEYDAWFCSAAECWYPIVYSAQEGSYFAQLTPGRLSEDTTKISQPFTASKGDRVSGWAFVQADDYNGTTYCDSAGQVEIKSDSGQTVATPFSQCAYGVYYTWYGYGGWQYWEHTFAEDTGAGKFQIEASVRSLKDDPAYSAMGLDDVKTSTLNPDTTKPSTIATRSIEPNAAGWNNKDVTVKLDATDNEGGWGVKKLTYSASGAQTIANTDASGSSAEVNLNAEGTTTLTYYATDKAGNVEASKTLTVNIDKTAPEVKSTSPASRATNVSTSAKISAAFSESGSGIDPSTINSDTFKVYQVTSSGNVPVSGKISYDAASKTVTFTPDRSLVKGTYQGYIHGYGAPPNVEDKADNQLRGGGDYSWSFSTTGKLCCGL